MRADCGNAKRGAIRGAFIPGGVRISGHESLERDKRRGTMKKYVTKRLLMMIPIMFGVIFLVFFMMSLLPGDPGRMILGMNATAEDVAAYNHMLGVDQPFPVRFVNYIMDLMQGDFGISYRSQRPVMEEIAACFPYTLIIATASCIVAYFIGIILGLVSALRQNTWVDFTGTVVSMLFASIPEFWLGLMMILLFSLQLKLLPTSGIGTFKHYIMPVIVVALPQAAITSRLTRTSMLDCINQDYVRTAKAKGLSRRKVIWNHTFKNALLPIITTMITSFGVSLGGTVVAENIFSIPGIGSLILNAIKSKDVPMVMACTILLSLIYCVFILIADIAVASIDPRIREVYLKRQ